MVKTLAPASLGKGTYLTGYPDARMVKLHIPVGRDTPRVFGRRGKVDGFSRQSRKRIMERIHTVRRDAALPHFVTLTFPDFFPTCEEAKRLLTVLFKRWKRRWPKTAALWRLEAMDRKSGASRGQVAPHFHLLVWGAFDGALAAQDWFEVNGESDYAHLKHGAQTKVLSDWKGASLYCAKYCAKESAFSSSGRVWGIHNRKEMPVAQPVTVLCRPWAVRRLINRAIVGKKSKTRRHRTLFCSRPGSIIMHLEGARTPHEFSAEKIFRPSHT